MNIFKNLTTGITICFNLLVCVLFISKAIAWENQVTHPAITGSAVERSVLASDYLQTQLGLNSNLNAQLELTSQFQNNINMRVAQEPGFKWAKTKISIHDWLMEGSKLEDVPNPRARHHFYDPIRNTGLNNSDANPVLLNAFWCVSKWLYPYYWGFNATGLSDLDRAKGLDGDWGNEYLNYYNWIYARGLFYAGLTEQSKVYREANLGSMFVTLGHICHLLEDMGVPAHTRNDFVKGHIVGDFYEKLSGRDRRGIQLGHPFEAWTESQIRNNGEQIPSLYLTRLMATPPVFSKLNNYWDTGICEPTGATQWQGDSSGWPGTGFGNPPPEKSWGLAECSNYQFLSYSTGWPPLSATWQSFPHPAKAHTRVDWYPTGPDGARQYYRIGYGVPHLTRAMYSGVIWGIPIGREEDTTEEEHVYEDYAKRTVSRTVDYTTGLINYFFRGRMQLRSAVESNLDNLLSVKLYIKNKSMLEASPLDYKFGFKGGSFEVYWDDASGNRTKVQSITLSKTWNASSTLAYDEEMWVSFNDTAGNDLENAVRFIVVYKGNIVKQPEYTIDDDDTAAIAVSTIETNHIHNIPTTTLLLARFKDIEECWFTEDVLFNHHGFRLYYTVEGISEFWAANMDLYNGRQISISPTLSHNRDRIFINVEEDYSTGPMLFNSGSWSDLQYFPETTVNACSCDAPYKTCNSIGTVVDCGGHCGTCVTSIWDIPDWQSNVNYHAGDEVGWYVSQDGCFEVYTCTADHVSSGASEPGFGANWQDYWLIGYPDVAVDLDIDGISESSEETPGGTVTIGSPLAKKINTMILTYWPPNVWTNELNRGSATLEVVTGADKIRIWDNANKVGQPLIDQSNTKKIWQLTSETVPINLYVEGITASDSSMDVRLKFSLNYAGVEMYDKVNFTVQN